MNLEKGFNRIGTLIGIVLGVYLVILAQTAWINSPTKKSLYEEYQRDTTGFMLRHIPFHWIDKSSMCGYKSNEEVFTFVYKHGKDALGEEKIKFLKKNRPNKWFYAYPYCNAIVFSIATVIPFAAGIALVRVLFWWVINGFKGH